MVVMVYKVTENTELVNAEPLLLGKLELGSCEPLVPTFSSSNQCITLFYVVFCNCSFATVELTANTTITHTGGSMCTILKEIISPESTSRSAGP